MKECKVITIKVNCQMKCKFARVIAKHFKDEPHP